MSDSVQPQRQQPTRLPHPWDSPGKNTGVGCHCLLQCMKVKSESEVAQSCATLSEPIDCSLPGSSAHGIFQARILEWGAIVLAVEGTLKSLLQHHSSKASILWHSAFFIVQLSHPYMHTEIQISSLHDFLFKSFENCYLLLANYPHPLDHRKKQENTRKNLYFCFTNYGKAFVWITKN